jgi:hypothetical protein
MSTKALPHQSLSVDKMLEVLLKDKVVESNSPKNRKKLYSRLQQMGLKYKVTIIGYTSGERCAKFIRSTGNWDVRRIAKWIVDKRLCKEDLKSACDISNQYWTGWNKDDVEHYKFKDVESIFEPGQTRRQIMDIINTVWAEPIKDYDKTVPLNFAIIRKTIASIVLLP